MFAGIALKVAATLGFVGVVAVLSGRLGEGFGDLAAAPGEAARRA
jgi:hypothetical protein